MTDTLRKPQSKGLTLAKEYAIYYDQNATVEVVQLSFSTSKTEVVKTTLMSLIVGHLHKLTLG
jgi:hypothetical protein